MLTHYGFANEVTQIWLKVSQMYCFNLTFDVGPKILD